MISDGVSLDAPRIIATYCIRLLVYSVHHFDWLFFRRFVQERIKRTVCYNVEYIYLLTARPQL